MVAKVKNKAKDILLTLFYTYKKAFLKAPAPPSNLSKRIWGRAEYDTLPAIPKIVWLYWHDQNIPRICQLCIDRIKKLNPGFKVYTLTSENLNSFLPDLFPYSNFNKDLPVANYSDIVRLFLLEKYGGFYLDASIILNTSLDSFIALNEETQTELVLFNLASITNKDAKSPMTENWFLGAIPNSKFIRDWKAEAYKCITSSYPRQYYQTDPQYINYVQRIPESLRTYLLVYISSQVVMQKSSQYRLLFLRSEESAYLYIKSMFWNFVLTNDLLSKIKQPKRLPLLIKLAHEGRKLADESLKDHMYLPDSILGNLNQPDTI